MKLILTEIPCPALNISSRVILSSHQTSVGTNVIANCTKGFEIADGSGRTKPIETLTCEPGGTWTPSLSFIDCRGNDSSLSNGYPFLY